METASASQRQKETEWTKMISLLSAISVSKHAITSQKHKHKPWGSPCDSCGDHCTGHYVTDIDRLSEHCHRVSLLRKLSSKAVVKEKTRYISQGNVAWVLRKSKCGWRILKRRNKPALEQCRKPVKPERRKKKTSSHLRTGSCLAGAVGVYHLWMHSRSKEKREWYY